MIIDAIFTILFILSGSILWYFISKRIPRLSVVSEEAMTAYMESSASRLHVFFYLAALHRRKYFRNIVFYFAEKILLMARVSLRSVDRGIIFLLKKLQRKNGASSKNIPSRTQYWKQIKEIQ